MLTEARGNTRGMIIIPRPIRSEQFNVQFSFEIGGGSGADGLALVLLEKLPAESDFSQGGNLGLEGLNGISVEFDTWANSWDPNGNHVGLNLLTGDLLREGTLLKGNISSLTTHDLALDLRETGVFDAEVAFENGLVKVYLSNTQSGMERTLVLQHTIPDFAAPQWYLGFTAATGGSHDRHVIHSIKLQAQAS